MKAESCLVFKWNSSGKNLLEEEIKSEMKNVQSYLTVYGVRKLVFDELDFTIHSQFDLKGWFEFEYLPGLANYGITKVAVVVPNAMIADLSEDKVENFSDPEFEFFSDATTALDWIN